MYYIDNIWNLDILDVRDYDIENNRRCRYVLVLIDNFSKFGWTVPSKNCSNKKELYEKFSDKLKKKTNLLETDQG